MAEFSKVPQEQKTKARWQKIMALPDSTDLRDISTGKMYKRGMFVELYQEVHGNRVEQFKVKGTGEVVQVSFLRLLVDDKTCSLVNQ